jgi:hypothetical protein
MVFTVSTVDFSGERSGGIPERFFVFDYYAPDIHLSKRGLYSMDYNVLFLLFKSVFLFSILKCFFAAFQYFTNVFSYALRFKNYAIIFFQFGVF